MSAEDEGGAWLRDLQASGNAGGTWPLKHEAANSLHQILDALPRSGADETTLRRLLPLLEEAARLVSSAGEGDRGPDATMAGMADFLYVSPIVGFANPIAPPFRFWIDDAAGVAHGRGRFRKVHEGGPGIVHGGILAAAVDELLGMATTLSGRAGMTGRLTMHYHHPTPILETLDLTARLDRVEGRRLHMSCDVHHGSVRTASADAVFVVVGGEKFADLDERRRAKERGA